MKLSTSLSLFSAAAASTATLFTESSNPSLNDKGLLGLHEGAGLNGLYLNDNIQPYVYNATTNSIYADIPNVIPGSFAVRAEFNTLLAGVAGVLAEPSDGYLTVNGSADLFYACKPGVPYDPYGYSKSSYGIAVFNAEDDVPSTCESLKIRALV